MPAKVFCRKYRKEMQGLVTPPFPGPRGLDIFNNVSQQAWRDWLAHQVRLINEKQLSMANAEHRQYLQEQMDKFLANEEFEQASGYVPETPGKEQKD